MYSYRLIFYRSAFVISLLGVLALLGEFGYAHPDWVQLWLDRFYYFVIFTGLAATTSRYLRKTERPHHKTVWFDSISLLLIVLILAGGVLPETVFDALPLLAHPAWIRVALVLTFMREFSERRINFKRTVLNPAQLFISSFLLIILSGTFLLLLPGATYSGLSFTDALFTATSAVCVTGLIVVDTGTYFTPFGQSIVLLLIQIGGLGILTFASYFSYFFKGGTTYENQLALSDMTSSRKLGEVFGTLKYILVITFGIELAAALLIYLTLPSGNFSGEPQRLFFALFHAVSAFCNAGFSTLQNGLYEEGFRHNYSLQLVIMATFVLGGLGFPIVVNLLRYLRYRTQLLFTHRSSVVYRPWVLNINSRITLITTISITAVAFLLYFLLEYQHTLSGHSLAGKIITALFGVTTPRTAGFNTIDMAGLSFPAIMLVILLMWIGASPQSTGGGIKTSTFAIATLNILSLAKGKNRIEVFRREISELSVRRAFATIALSLIVIGTGIILLAVFEPGMDLRNIAFECFSAYSTVGLSLGITAGMSTGSKLVLIVVMFVGRVSMLTIVIAVFRKVRQKNYRYPQEELTIN